MTVAMSVYKICRSTARTLRLAVLTPVFAAGGVAVDTLALRGNFKPVIASYHAICARDRHDTRCRRLAELTRGVASNEKAPGSPGLASSNGVN